MEILTSFLAFFKGIFPALMGSLIAIWRKKDGVHFGDKTLGQKLTLTFVIVCAMIVGVCIGKWVGGAVVAYFGVEQSMQIILIEFISALNGLKIVDSMVKSGESTLDIITENVPIFINKVFEAISDKIDKFFKK